MRSVPEQPKTEEYKRNKEDLSAELCLETPSKTTEQAADEPRAEPEGVQDQPKRLYARGNPWNI